MLSRLSSWSYWEPLNEQRISEPIDPQTRASRTTSLGANSYANAKAISLVAPKVGEAKRTVENGDSLSPGLHSRRKRIAAIMSEPQNRSTN